MIIPTSKGIVSYRYQRIYLDGVEIGKYFYDTIDHCYRVNLSDKWHRVDRIGMGVKWLLEAMR